jgi:biopolymer transport protein ExbD
MIATAVFLYAAPSYAQVRTVRDANVDLPVVTVTNTGRLYLNDKHVNISNLVDEINRGFPAAVEVYVRPDKQTPWEPVSQVIEVLSQAKTPLSVKFVALRDLK